MFNLKLFPLFDAPPAASAQDARFLEGLRLARNRFDARFVNFSFFDYAKENPDTAHFLTYPMAWISTYVRNYYAANDPFNRVDFRRVAHFDWEEMYTEGSAREMFLAFSEAGLGRHALSVSTHAGSHRYGVLSLVIRDGQTSWAAFKRERMEEIRIESDRLTGLYRSLYLMETREPPRLTPRELEALRLVALGQTDDRIAQTMGIGRWTVISHLQSAKYKLGCANRPSAVARAITIGLIDLQSTG